MTADLEPLHVVDGAGRTTLWNALRIASVADLSLAAEYASLTVEQRLQRASTADAAYLTHHLLPDAGGAVELRMIHEPGARQVQAVVLARTTIGPYQDLRTAARGQLERLGRLPDRVTAEPVTEQELASFLRPFEVPPGGAIEVRKPVLVGVPQRPDAYVDFYFAVQPWQLRPVSWAPLLEALRRHPSRVMVAIGLEPVGIPISFPAFLEHLTTQYARLAQPTRTTLGPLTGVEVDIPPDAFAVHALRLFQDASRRYRRAAFRVRVDVVSEDALDDGLGHLLGQLICPGQEHQDSYLERDAAGAAYELVRPADHQELGVLRDNLAGLGHARWGQRAFWHADDSPPSSLRDLSELVDVNEATAAFRLPVAPTGVLPGLTVRHPGPSNEVHWTVDAPHLKLGRQRGGGQVGLQLQDLTRHALLVGTTGSGKTNSSLALLEQLWVDHQIPFLVLEPVNSKLDDYRWLATRPGFEQMLVLTVGNEKIAPFRLNPFQVPAGVSVGAHAAGLLSCFDSAFGLWDPLPNIYRRALRLTYTTAGWSSDDVADGGPDEHWPTLDSFITSMRQVTNELDYQGEVRSNILAGSMVRAESLAEGVAASTLACRSSFPVDVLLSRPVVIELAQVSENAKEQALVTALLLQIMTEHYKATRQPGGLQHVTVIEEAHRLLARPTAGGAQAHEGDARARAAEAFANSLAENRKYGEALVIIDQDPTKLITDAVKNTGTKIMHRLPGTEDRDVLAGAMGLSEDQRSFAMQLGPMQALVHHDGLPQAAVVEVPDVRRQDAQARGVERAPLATDEDLRRVFEAFVATTPGVEDALRPYDACAGCTSPCWFRGQSEMLAHTASAPLKVLLDRYSTVESDPARALWWGEVHATVEAAAKRASHSLAPNHVVDLHGCVFLHGLRNHFDEGTEGWVARFRDTHPAVT